MPKTSIKVSKFSFQLICLELIYICTMKTYPRLVSNVVTLVSAKVNSNNSHGPFNLFQFGVRKKMLRNPFGRSEAVEGVKHFYPGKEWNKTWLQPNHTYHFLAQILQPRSLVNLAHSLGIFLLQYVKFI